MAKELTKSNSTGMDIIMAANGVIEELDITSNSEAEVIDPNAISQAISEQASEEDINPLSIKDETKDLKVDDEVESEDDDDSTGLDIKKEEPKVEKEEKKEEVEDTIGDPETFKILGEHFSNEGILEGYDEEMENTPEAFQTMIEKTVEKRVNEYKDNLNTPVAKQFLEYIENGGDPGQFFQLVSGPDYSKVTPEEIETNDAAQKQILRAYYNEQGESAEDIEDTIQAFEDAGKLGKRANSALEKLQKTQIEYRQNEVTRVQTEKAEKQKEVQTYINNLQTDINGRDEIGGFQINKKNKSDLFDYVTKVDPKTGQTKLLTDSQDPEKQLLMTFLYFNNFNFNKLEKKVKANTTKDLMSKLSRQSDTGLKQKSIKQTPAHKTEPGNVNLGVLKKLFK